MTKKKKPLNIIKKAADVMRNAYGDFRGNTLSDIKTVVRGGSDLLGGGKRLALTAAKQATAAAAAKRAAKRAAKEEAITIVPSGIEADAESHATNIIKKAAGAGGEGRQVRRGNKLQTARSGTVSSTNPAAKGYKIEIEEVKDKAKGGMIKKAKGGMAKKTSAKKTTAKKTSTRSKPKGVGVATRGYGRAMR